MNAPAALPAIAWLIRDTFREARASGIFWLMLGVTALCIAACLSAGITGDVPVSAEGAVRADARGELTLAFGAISTGQLSRDRHHAVRFLECVLAGWVADAAGILLALMWTAGFLPSFLDPAQAAVLLAKPAPRWSLLAGKYLGVLVFVALQALLFIGGTWLALAVRTGVWDPTYFLCLPILLLHFAVFYSFSAMLAVATRSAVVSAFGAILFWLLCWAMNFGRHAARGIAELGDLRAFGTVSEVAYWVMPKPLDFHLILVELLQADNVATRVVDVEELAKQGAWSPGLSVLASLVAGAVLLGVAAYDFVKADY
jgi:ABC-type transport system involved in multi-copper enzyme maturation permease subunit